MLACQLKKLSVHFSPLDTPTVVDKEKEKPFEEELLMLHAEADFW